MARLPQPGGDNGNWGTILNDYLSQTLKPDGTIKDNAVTSSSIAPNSITNAAIATNAVDAATIADGSITEVLLAPAVQTKLNAIQLISANAQTTGYTLVLGDAGRAIDVTSASGVNVTVPLNSSVAFAIGTVISISQLGAGAVTIVPTGGVTLSTSSTLVTRVQYSELSIRKLATDTWLVTGDMQ